MVRSSFVQFCDQCMSLCSWYSLEYSKVRTSRATQGTVQFRVLQRNLQLWNFYMQTIWMRRKTRAISLVSQPPEDTLVILVCKVLVPLLTKGTFTMANRMTRQAKNHSTRAVRQVCPQFLVQVKSEIGS